MLRTHLLLFSILLLTGLSAAREARAQCMLANPSFEVAGSGTVFGGWNEFGVFGSTSSASHGQVAARVSGPNLGGWDVSGYWQALEATPGERLAASVCVWHTQVRPLTGQSTALLNIEWRDAGGGLISYESHAPATASTPTDEFVQFAVESGPAPAGTATARLLLGVLQSPTDPSPDVYFDQATFTKVGPPSQDDLQWPDFPGGRTLDFSGRTWRVKGTGYYGPGPNFFSDASGHIWVDASDQLHVTIKNAGGTWYSTEAVLEEALGYGDYVFTLQGRVDLWHANAVLGLFIWEYGPCFEPENSWWNPYNEIDIEISRWGDPGNDVAQFVAQPWDWSGNVNRFDPTAGNPTRTSYAFLWLPDRIEFRSWRGGPDDESAGNMIHTWTYTGPHIPRPEQPRVHINFWQFMGPPSVDQEAVFEAFTFVPACFGPHCVTGVAAAPNSDATLNLSAAAPNPFSARTTIRYAMAREGRATIGVYDISGRLVRNLVNGFAAAGPHEVVWDGRDRAGHRVVPGVYLYRMQVGAVSQARRMVVLH